jgi:uncharacterized protein (DUF305 family)
MLVAVEDRAVEARRMARAWAAVAAALGVIVVLVATLVWVTDGPFRGSWMMDGAARNREVGGAGRGFTGPGHMGAGPRDEYHYLVKMIAHHEEAITAAGELSRSESPRMRTLGADIVSSQTRQVEQMSAWLESWYADRPGSTDDYRPMMRDLGDLSGARLDRVFLVDMIGHHMMAVMDSQRLLMMGDIDHDKVADLARDIRDDQHAEVWQMQRWLRERFGSSVSARRTGMMGMLGTPRYPSGR